MSGVGRPNRLAAEQRRRAVTRMVARWASESTAAVKRLAEGLHATERTIRSDLEWIAEGEGDDLRVSADLAAELEKVKTADALSEFTRRIMVERSARRLSLGEASFYMGACRELRQAFKDAKRETSDCLDLGPLLKLDDVPLDAAPAPTPSDSN